MFQLLEAGGGRIFLDKPLSKAEFIALSERFPDLQMEREATGKTSIAAPLKKGAGERESRLMFWVGYWAFNSKKGAFHGSSIGIEFPDGSVKSPDCAWVSNEQLLASPAIDEEDFLRIIPGFVAEVRSSSDRLNVLKKKMSSVWMAHGVRLAWLIDPYDEKVYIYRSGQETEVVEGFEGKILSGEAVMPGMEMPLEEFKKK